jgi:hypothetical protein
MATKAMKRSVEWLLEGPDFVRYRTLMDLEGLPASSPRVTSSCNAMVEDPLVAGLVAEVNGWERQPELTRHNDAGALLHKLVFCADIGVKRDALAPAIESILSHQSPEGPFQVRIRIPKAFGGDDVPKWDWVATDAPLVLYTLLRLGVRTKQVMRGVKYVVSRAAEPGFPCFASASLGRFKGPGRRGDPCPYANLIALRMMAEAPGLIDSPEARRAATMLLTHWEERKTRKYYLFGIGTDFAKPKAPMVWYDILHYLDTLSRFPWCRSDPRLRECAAVLRGTADTEGRFTSGSIWTKWKGWEFCQKKEPSRWITLLALRALGRMNAL